MNTDNYIEVQCEDGTIVHCSLYDKVLFEGKEYFLFTVKGYDNQVMIMQLQENGEECCFSTIDNEDELMRVWEYIQNMKKNETSSENTETELYDMLNKDEYRHGSYEVQDLSEGMELINESMRGWWKPRYLINHNTKKAYKFIDGGQYLLTVTQDDIDWDSLKDLSEDALICARELSFQYPSFISKFNKGVAEVRWQLNPDGRYFMDDDGFGMTDDEEVNIYGFIDQNAKVVVKFRNIKNSKEHDTMRKEAETIVSKRTT